MVDNRVAEYREAAKALRKFRKVVSDAYEELGESLGGLGILARSHRRLVGAVTKVLNKAASRAANVEDWADRLEKDKRRG